MALLVGSKLPHSIACFETTSQDTFLLAVSKTSAGLYSILAFPTCRLVRRACGTVSTNVYPRLRKCQMLTHLAAYKDTLQMT